MKHIAALFYCTPQIELKEITDVPTQRRQSMFNTIRLCAAHCFCSSCLLCSPETADKKKSSEPPTEITKHLAPYDMPRFSADIIPL